MIQKIPKTKERKEKAENKSNTHKHTHTKKGFFTLPYLTSLVVVRERITIQRSEIT
jgi:hypothetical protein